MVNDIDCAGSLCLREREREMPNAFRLLLIIELNSIFDLRNLWCFILQMIVVIFRMYMRLS